MATKHKLIADLGLATNGDLSVDGNATITGNLTVNGTTITINSTTTSVEDSLLELANQNTSSDTIDIGFYGNYDDGLSDDASEYTGLFRDASDSTWKLFDGLEVEPGTTVDTTGSGYAKAALEVGDLTATTLNVSNSITGASISYPTSDGTSGQVLTTNGSGTLTFQDAGSGLSEGSVTTTSTSETNLDTWSSSTYRSVKYTISISDSTAGDYEMTEIHVLHDGTNAYFSQFGTVLAGTTSELVSFGVDISGGDVRLRITPASTNSTAIKFKKIEIGV
jgi:hypothetical protein